MMKRNILAVVIPALLAAGAANAAEIYNKDGNKLDLYGKVDGLHYFSDDKVQTVISLTLVSASKAKLRFLINWLVMVSGNTTSKLTTLKATALLKTQPVWALLA